MAVDFHLVAIETVQAVFCSDPDKSLEVFDDGAHVTVAKSIFLGDLVEENWLAPKGSRRQQCGYH